MKYTDPLEKPLNPERVNYANGMLLDEKDFKDEQAYYRGRLSRALAYLHGPGTVAGLKVTAFKRENPDEQIIKVQPGLAIDTIGRLVELPTSYCIRAQQWFETQKEEHLDKLKESYDISDYAGQPKAVVADLFIKFNICDMGMTPYFGVGNFDATDAFTAARLRDSARLSMVLRYEANLGERVPQEIPYDVLPAVEPDQPLNFNEAKENIRKFKFRTAKKEADFWNKSDSHIKKGPEHTVEQDGTEILLARLRLPATNNPIEYDITHEIDENDIANDIRLLSYSTYELFWLANATKGGN